MIINASLEKTALTYKEVFKDTDFFEGVYTETPWMSYLMILCYLVGSIFMSGLALIVRFEVTGQAGQYRVLFNQLMSFILSQMCLFYFGPNFLDTLRIIVGPLPQTICTMSIFIKNFIYINLALCTLAQTLIKFMCVCIYRSILSMNDDFLSLFIVLLSNLISFGAVGIRFFLPGKPILQELICRGYYSDKFDDEEPSINTTTMIAGGCFFVHVILSIIIAVTDYKWRKKPTINANGNRSKGISLGDLKSGWVVYILVIGGSVIFTKMNQTHPKLLITYPHNILVFIVQIIAPACYAITLCLLFFPRHKQLRRSVTEIFKTKI